ncbi:lipase 3-like [Battus philenor]|uniref:lipase 3-like n=1 Tax=Battus philenor TaxID=42288 RepID=UPI0035CEE1B9
MSTDVIDAVNNMKSRVSGVLSCIACSYQEKRDQLRDTYNQLLNETIIKIKNLIPFEEDEKEDENVEVQDQSITTSIMKTTTKMKTTTTTTEKIVTTKATVFTTTTFEPNISYVARRMSQPINQPVDLKNRTEQVFGTSTLLDIVKHHGYNTEVHTVITPDGYMLTLHRITSQNKIKGHAKNRTAILQHGLLGSSTDWILLGPNISLPYMLINAGYDVWLTNARGNKFSKAHVTKSIHTAEYWDFSWHEIGLFDLSSSIDYIREKSFEKSQIIFIAHSMGATALMVLLSTSPQYNSILSLVVLLAPLVFMQQAKGPLRLLSEFQNLDQIATLKILGIDMFNPSAAFLKVSRRKFCREEDKRLCLNTLLLLVDGGKAIENARKRRNILENLPAGGSVKTILHFCQLINSGRFEMFDAGSTMNIKKYGTVSPPKYHLREIKLPIALFNSQDDWLSTAPDIVSLLSYLPNPVTHHIVASSDEFGHFDFVWGAIAPKLVYKFIIEILDQY